MNINGSAIIAMTGKNCVAICSDLRFGEPSARRSGSAPRLAARARRCVPSPLCLMPWGSPPRLASRPSPPGVNQQTLGTDMKKIFRIHDRLYLGLTGLGTDIQTL